jgi:SagB-type dehydrogenase family enzyme
MKRRELLLGLAAAGLAGCAGRAPKWTTGPGAHYGAPTPLPAPAQDGSVSLERAIMLRRSVRTFAPNPLPQAIIGQLLWAGQGITDPRGKRAAPSAGALYPVQLYVVTSTQVMHYLPDGHRVETRTTPDLRPELRTAALDQNSVGAAPAVIVIAAQPDRTRHRYGSFADAFVDLEVGHVAQNILLTAAAHDLAAVPVGSMDTARCARALALAPGQDVHYLIPVGRRAAH